MKVSVPRCGSTWLITPASVADWLDTARSAGTDVALLDLEDSVPHHRKDAADVHGRVIGVSAGFPGSWHDMRCFTEAGLGYLAEAAGTALGDAGYQGSDMTTPNKKKPGQDRTESDITYNTSLAVLRAAVEWANAHLKNWRILTTRYRDSLHRFDPTITAVAGLTILNEQHSQRPLAFARLNKLQHVSE
ncbi:MAG: transposase family protein [Pseudonocardiaceae bacterium]